MGDKLKPLTEYERAYAEEYHYLIIEFLKRSRLDIEEFYDVVVMNYLLSVQTYLNDMELQRKCNFEAVSYMYMRRALYVHFRKDKAQKRSSENERDISLDEIDICVSDSKAMETVLNLEHMETMKEITTQLSEEQSMILFDKINGFSLKEIADNHGIKQKRVYTQFNKVKRIVADVMEI